jgi:hypothetical protein
MEARPRCPIKQASIEFDKTYQNNQQEPRNKYNEGITRLLLQQAINR